MLYLKHMHVAMPDIFRLHYIRASEKCFLLNDGHWVFRASQEEPLGTTAPEEFRPEDSDPSYPLKCAILWALTRIYDSLQDFYFN